MDPLRPVDQVAVIGAGTMGAGIAQVVAAAGHETLLYDTNRTAAERAVEDIRRTADRLVARGRLDAAGRDRLLAGVRPVDDIDAIADARLVIEAIIEDLATKRSLFGQLEGLCREQAILATNTSSLSVTAIGSALARPGNLIGMHFFNPAPVMKLVEVVSGLNTSAAVAEAVSKTLAGWGKQPVLARSTPGFIVNRVARPFYAEALRLLEEGVADVATLDAVMREGGGFRMGPFELMDLIGQDVNYAVTSSVFSAFHHDPRFVPSLLQKEMVDGGLLGRKSGRGFYDYRVGAQWPEPATAAREEPPHRIEIQGSLGAAQALIGLWEGAGIEVKRRAADEGVIVLDGCRIALSDGRSATSRAADDGHPDTILFDLALDYGQATRIAMAPAVSASGHSVRAASGLFQALGKQVSTLTDAPGLPVARTVCMLANEAAEAVLQQVCDENAVDTAMQSGVNYPLGPLAWADRLTPAWTLKVVGNLQQAYGWDRYRPSQLLRRKAEGGQPFHTQAR